ncbi:SusC/RagA family TonB-linked outer membrane protein [Pedobacter sp. MC2016-14]|uniref:SusC/RagA family TonB-linked outer membrane protein n=1 Tax=Pedobacter sp. MC2016-14 TaxID=2897327 RepID=UPI001E65C6F8|nr:SusC/RagA family TonB-linked outer membrane protein [Pedobacter sp. MC2016-14]MCD0489403.1 SusC/RagA family TonB-linked outer membrane protein [Pedobacter sp. MC2016-14]
MKINAVLLITILTSVSGLMASSTKAQSLDEVTVSFGLNKAPLKNALSQIENQTDFRFAYKKELLGAFNQVSLLAQTRTVKSALDQLLFGTGILYRQLNNSIILYKTTETNTLEVLASGQQKQITGTVRDENGQPMPGVSVRVKGQPNVVSTTSSGKYAIDVTGNTAYLVFRYIGYAAQEYKAEAGQVVNINLKPEAGTLDAVVVIGYGTTTKRVSTGSVTSITAKDIASQPVSDPLAALQGRVAGLDITATTGYSGSAYTVRLRGINSILGGNDPFYIIDGMPFISEPLNQFSGANGQTSPLNSINPSDIERIDILKDADATAIYGSRGANGVILITTKKGKSGKTSVDAKVYSGAAFVNHKIKMLDAQQYLLLRKEAFANDGTTPDVDNAPDLLSWDQNLDNNWQEKLTGNTARFNEAQLSVSGGSELTNFLLSGTYRKEGNVTPGNQDYKRGALNFNVNHKSLDNKFTLNTSVKYVGDWNNSFVTDMTQYYNLSPNMPVYQPDGKYFWVGNTQNPFALFEREYESRNNNLFGNVLAKYAILPSLNAQVSLGYNRITMNQTQTVPEISSNPTQYVASTGAYGNNEVNSYIVEPQLDYVRNIGKGKLNLLAGGTFQSNLREGQNLLGSGFASDEQLKNPYAAVALTSRGYNYTDYKYTSIFGRATYNWDEKYIINGTFRRDGSSRFGPDKKFGNFGAVGAAWLFGNESLVKDNLHFLSFGKLRGSYGTSGNDQIGDYQYYDSWSSASFPYAGSGTLFPTRFANPVYQWEVSRKLEFAMELGFFKSRVLLTAAYYRNRSGNMLIDYPLSPQSGFPSYLANLPAKLENRGFELELNSINVNNDDFKWNTSFNVTSASNKLLEYPGLESSSLSDRYFIGQPINVTTGYQSTGIDSQTGLPTFVDRNGDEEISEEEDLAILGTITPQYYGGMSNNFSYKNWSLDFFFQFVKQEGPSLNSGYLSGPYGSLGNKDISALNRWTTPGQITDIPVATASGSSDAAQAYGFWRTSSANWKDASFIRLKNVALRYNLTSVVKNLKISNLTLFVQGQNLFTITKYDGFDPETKGLVLPPLSVYTAGLQVSF